MESLFAKRETVCIEVTREKHRKEMKALIEKYDNQMKEAIVDFYKAHDADIKRIIDVCDELKTCEDLGRLKVLKQDYENFRRTCREFISSRSKVDNRRNTFLLYETEHGSGRKLFPLWDVEVIQEWLVYWKVPVLLGGSSMNRGPESWEESAKMYHIPKSKNELVVEIDQDYKGEEIWLSFVKTICDCHRWRERYNLMHLDAIVLHAK